MSRSRTSALGPGSSASFRLRVEGRTLGPVSLTVPGLHNVRNAAAAMTMAYASGVAWDSAAAAIGLFGGVAGVSSCGGERDGITFVDDYGHLPGEGGCGHSGGRAEGGRDRGGVPAPPVFADRGAVARVRRGLLDGGRCPGRDRHLPGRRATAGGRVR